MMDSRGAILFVSQCLPFPPHTGVTNRTYNIIKQLLKDFHVSLVAFARMNHQPDEAAHKEAVGELRRLGVDVLGTAWIPSEWSRARLIRVHAASVMTRRPYPYYVYDSSRIGTAIRAGLRCRPDLVHLDSLDLYRWSPRSWQGPVTCTHHSVESELLALRARQTSSWLKGRYLGFQARLIERVERALTPKFSCNLMMSQADSDRLNAIAPRARTRVVPNGVDTDFFRPGPPPESGRVVFLGPSYMQPNRDAIRFFLSNIWPLVRAEVPGATFQTIGRCPESDRREFERVPGVRCQGYLEDIRPAMAAAECSIVPLRVGGGTRLKILDAWAMGKAVVSTSVGAEGLEVVEGENILIRDDPRSFAEAVIRILQEPELRRHLERGARETAMMRYSWSRIGAELREHYGELIRNERRGAGAET